MQNTSHLIPIIKQGYDQQLVDARLLHQFLESGNKFSDWIKERIDVYGFIDGRDFFGNLRKSTGGRRAIEYAITLDMAKELAMLERNEKGRQARQYFINAEKELRRLQASLLSGFDEMRQLLAEVTTFERDGTTWYLANQIKRLCGKVHSGRNKQQMLRLQKLGKATLEPHRGQKSWFVKKEAIHELLFISRSQTLATSIVKLLSHL